MILIWVLVATFVVSAIGLIGVFTLSVSHHKLSRWLDVLVALAAGVMLGSALLHLLPEAAEGLAVEVVFQIVLVTILVFVGIEKVLKWHHCHDIDCEKHTTGYMNLIGDGIHNFLDGLLIAGAFLGGFELGVLATLAVIIHEIPQEISDFGVLVYSGMTRQKALFFNFLSALMAVLGGVIGLVLGSQMAGGIPILLAVAGGSFLYISVSDLMPELREVRTTNEVVRRLVVLLIGVWLTTLSVPHV